MVVGERSSLQMRTPLPPSSVLRAMQERLSLRPTEMSGIVCDGRIELYAPPGRLSLRSVQLVVDVEPAASPASHPGSLLVARYDLHPHLWALSLACAAISSCGALAALVFGYAQLVMGQPPSALFGLLVSVGVWGSFRLLRRRAQRVGGAERQQLQRFLEASLCEAERPSERSGSERASAPKRCTRRPAGASK